MFACLGVNNRSLTSVLMMDRAHSSFKRRHEPAGDKDRRLNVRRSAKRGPILRHEARETVILREPPRNYTPALFAIDARKVRAAGDKVGFFKTSPSLHHRTSRDGKPRGNGWIPVKPRYPQSQSPLQSPLAFGTRPFFGRSARLRRRTPAL